MRVIGVVPAYNEGSRIAEVLRAYLVYLDMLVVVDDGSKDDTSNVASCVAGQDRLRVIRFSINRGQGAALRAGNEAALRLGADIIIHLDADGQHDPKNIPVMLAPIREGKAEVVFGSRFMGIDPTGMPAMRRLLMIGIRFFNLFALGIPKTMTDPQSGLRAMTANAARRIIYYQDRMAHTSEILRFVTRSDLRWMEVPAHILYTQESLRKGNKTTDALSIAWQIFLGKFTK